MRIASIAGAALLAGALGFGSAICEEARPLYDIGEGGLALQGFDPVACIEQGEVVPGREEIQAEYHGIVYRFASGDDRFWQDLMKEFAREADRERGESDE